MMEKGFFSNPEPGSVPANPDIWPSGIVDADKAAGKSGLTVEELNLLASSGQIPHYRINGRLFGFIVKDVREWVLKNYMHYVPGVDLPVQIKLIPQCDPISTPPPICISQIANLRQIPVVPALSGIYFLCDAERLLYVGQSLNVAARLAQHVDGTSGVARVIPSEITRIYFLPLPIPLLTPVESALIRHLSPPWNGTQGVPIHAEGKQIARHARASDLSTLELLGIGVTNMGTKCDLPTAGNATSTEAGIL